MTATQTTFPAAVADDVLRAHFAGQLLAMTGHPVPDDVSLDNVLATMDRLCADPDFVARDRLVGEHFHQVTEAEHKQHRGEYKDVSTTERPCKRVWIIADEMVAIDPQVRRKDVIDACVAAGVAFYTARTQYQLWLGVRKEMAAREAIEAEMKRRGI